MGVLTDCSCHPWRNASGFDQPQSRHPVEPFVRPPSTARWRSVGARSCASQTLALAPRKAVLFVCFADRATCILTSCSCHPWRNIPGFANPQSCHPWQAVRPSESGACRLLRRPGLTLSRTPAEPHPARRRLALCLPSVVPRLRACGMTGGTCWIGFSAAPLKQSSPTPSAHP